MLALSGVMKNWPDDKVARTNPAAPAGARRSALGGVSHADPLSIRTAGEASGVRTNEPNEPTNEHDRTESSTARASRPGAAPVSEAST